MKIFLVDFFVNGHCGHSVATHSRWLMQKVEQSLLAAAMAEARVIPYGSLG